MRRMTRLSVLALVLLGCNRPAKVAPPADAVPVAAVPVADTALAKPIDSTNTVSPTVTRDDTPLPPPSETLGPPPDAAAGVKLVKVATGLDRPVALVAAPGDTRKRLFIVEQVGAIRILENGAIGEGRFLDIRRDVSRDNEQGLLGLAFHPRFQENRKIYVNYTDRGGDTHVDEYTVSATDMDKVDLASHREVLRVEQPYSNHNGGHVLFGPDGKLWVGMGDGGAAGDPKKAGQDDKQRLAKMLRIDVDAAKPTVEIVAKGLRNPWRYSFDPVTNDLYIGDVGQNAWESIFVVAGDNLTGHNFGWSVAEGRHCYESSRCDMSKFTPPVADYSHSVGCSVTGGVVYRGKALPALDGVYFYADYCTAVIRSFRWRPDGIRQHWEWKPILDPDSRLGQISSFGVDHDGEIYMLLLGGDVFRLSSR
jgi:glucose/arabinose dehydrogenase